MKKKSNPASYGEKSRSHTTRQKIFSLISQKHRFASSPTARKRTLTIPGTQENVTNLPPNTPTRYTSPRAAYSKIKLYLTPGILPVHASASFISLSVKNTPVEKRARKKGRREIRLTDAYTERKREKEGEEVIARRRRLARR